MARIFSGKAVSRLPSSLLCGKVWVPSRDPKRYPICPTCKEIHDQLRDRDGADDVAAVAGGEQRHAVGPEKRIDVSVAGEAREGEAQAGDAARPRLAAAGEGDGRRHPAPAGPGAFCQDAVRDLP